MKFADLRKFATMKRQIAEAERTVRITQDACVAVTTGLADVMMQKMEIENWIAENQERIDRYNKREKDLRTLNTLTELIQAQCPADEQPGEETKYISALNDSGIKSIGKLIKLIVEDIQKEYTP